MNKEMRKEFLDMLKEERNSETGWAIIMSMVSMVEEDGVSRRTAPRDA